MYYYEIKLECNKNLTKKIFTKKNKYVNIKISKKTYFAISIEK